MQHTHRQNLREQIKIQLDSANCCVFAADVNVGAAIARLDNIPHCRFIEHNLRCDSIVFALNSLYNAFLLAERLVTLNI